MRKILFVIAALAALGGMGYVATWVSAQEGVKPAGGTGESKPTLKIGVVNITKVIKEFKKANVLGDKILADAQKYETELKGIQETLKGLEAKMATLPTEADKEAARRNLRQQQIDLQDKDLLYQKDIRKRRDEMAIEINKDMKRIMDSIARYHGFELVLTCPDVGDVKEVDSLSDAMRRMTAPACWIAWKHPGLDITDECVQWLNHYCPAPGVVAGAVTPASATK